MNELKIFNNERFGEVRTSIINDEPYFMLADVCRVLEIANPRNTLQRLNKNGVHNIDTIDSMGRTQQANFINESNLYKLAFTSRKKEAEEFTEWVTSEVLPSIRKHGGYVVNKPMNQLEILAQSVKILQEQEQKLAEHDTRIEKIENNVNEIKELEKMNVSNWRLYFGTITRKIAQYYPILENENPYHVVRSEFYRLLEAEAHCDLTRRLKYKKERAYKSGFSKTRINEINKLDVIQEDNRLVNSAIAVLKKMSIQYGFN